MDDALEKSQTEQTGQNIVWIVKTFLFVVPPTLVSRIVPNHPFLFDASFILGALFQAIIPPRRYRFFHILGVGVVAAVVSAIAQTRGWW